MNSPHDASALEKLLDEGAFKAKDIVAVIGKSEGSGGVNDYTRGDAADAFDALISERIGVSSVDNKVALIFSGGCEGVISPHGTVFVREEAESQESNGKRLAVGVGFTRDMLPEEMGTAVQVRLVAEAVKEAMKDALIDDPKDVHFVQTKEPLLTPERIVDAFSRGNKVITVNTGSSMLYSNGAAALGIALGLGEVDDSDVNDEVICNDWDLYSEVASPSSGIELMNNKIAVIGLSDKYVGDLVVGHALIRTPIDIDGVYNALRNAGLEFGERPKQEDLDRVVAVFAKSPHLDPSGKIKGRRTTILTEGDIRIARITRGIIGTTVACAVGDPMVYVSGGRAQPTHTGPRETGPIAIIVKT
jgi:cyanuric acid amidohydrolase